MTAGIAEPPGWKALRWSAIIALVFGLQVLLIFWLSDRTPLQVRPPHPAPPLSLPQNVTADAVALENPTLFALPSINGFSGPAWLAIIPTPRPPAEWAEGPRWLSLAPGQLVTGSIGFAVTNLGVPPLALRRVEPEASLPERLVDPLFPEVSTLALKGGLATRQLLTKVELPSQPHTDLLANSTVLMMVDPSGRPASANLIDSSGSKAVDQYALEQARKLRFNRLPDTGAKATHPAGRMTWGYLVFNWHTLPQPDTNSISRTP